MKSPIRMSPEPALERAGELRDGTPVLCNMVFADDPEAETYLIIPGCGGKVGNYKPLQEELAIHGMNSVCSDPIYRLSRHPNRLQADAAATVMHYAEDEYGLHVRHAYGHSWGGSKLASLLNHSVDNIEHAVFHNTAGLESALVNLARHPANSARKLGVEIVKVVGCMAERGKIDVESLKGFFDHPAIMQHILVASEHRKLQEHLETAKDFGVKVVGLWAEEDVFFKKKHDPIFDHNEVIPDSIHTEPQCAPDRVASKLVELAQNV